MKYKKQIATGALAISLLVSGSNVFAATPQDLGIKNSQQVSQNKNRSKNLKTKATGRSNVVGTIEAINSTGFTVDVKNMKTKIISSVDVEIDSSTTYSKNGITSSASDLSVGQKVIVTGSLDKTTNIITAKKVKIIVTTQ
jgi:hypothetical protein